MSALAAAVYLQQVMWKNNTIFWQYCEYKPSANKAVKAINGHVPRGLIHS